MLFLLTTFLIGCGVSLYRQSRGDARLTAWRDQQILNARQISTLAPPPIGEPVARPNESVRQELLSQKRRLVAKVNLNTATAEELAALERIGPVMAERIVLYRIEHGPFKTIEQVQQVKGIGPKIFSRIRERIEVE